MTRVQVETYVRADDCFQPVREIQSYQGDCDYVPGAISLIVDEVDVLGVELWDDVNWLWPFIVRALDECRRTGSGKTSFPDQAIHFTAETAYEGNLLLTVKDGASISRSVVAPADDLYKVVARAGLEFFAELQRLCPRTQFGREEGEILDTWL